MKVAGVGMHTGAIWRLIDLQVHSPRDPNWVGSEGVAGGTLELEEKRLSWAKDFVRACRNKGLQAVAITDHHDTCMIAYVREAIKALDLTTDLWLFPGIEVTCDDACQAIVLFDVAAAPDDWDRLYGKLPNVQLPSSRDKKHPPTIPCGKTVQQLIEDISKDSFLGALCIVLPHAGNSRDHKTVTQRKFHMRFANLGCDGFYSDKPFEKLQQSTTDKVFGKSPDWGTRRRGLLPTGDNRKADFSDLGSSPCWVRLGEPTTEKSRTLQ